MSLNASANPIIINFSHDFLWSVTLWGEMPLWVPILAAVVALLAEFFFVKALIGRDVPKIQNFGVKFVIIHSVTFPLTQFAALWLGPISELIPVLGEKCFYNRDKSFKSWGYKGWLVVICSNVLSYFIGYLVGEIYVQSL